MYKMISNFVNNFTINRGLYFAGTTYCIQSLWDRYARPIFTLLEIGPMGTGLLFFNDNTGSCPEAYPSTSIHAFHAIGNDEPIHHPTGKVWYPDFKNLPGRHKKNRPSGRPELSRRRRRLRGTSRPDCVFRAHAPAGLIQPKPGEAHDFSNRRRGAERQSEYSRTRFRRSPRRSHPSSCRRSHGGRNGDGSDGRWRSLVRAD